MKAKFGNHGENPGADTLFVIFFIFFLLLIFSIPAGGYCYANRDTIKVQITDMTKDTETFVSMTKGGKHYKAMKSTDRLGKVITGDSFIMVLADWCGHCKRLKESGTLEEVSKDIPVIVLDDKHPESQDVMKQLKSQGFPTLGMIKGGKMVKYEGGRDASSMKAAFMA